MQSRAYLRHFDDQIAFRNSALGRKKLTHSCAVAAMAAGAAIVARSSGKGTWPEPFNSVRIRANKSAKIVAYKSGVLTRASVKSAMQIAIANTGGSQVRFDLVEFCCSIVCVGSSREDGELAWLQRYRKADAGCLARGRELTAGLPQTGKHDRNARLNQFTELSPASGCESRNTLLIRQANLYGNVHPLDGRDLAPLSRTSSSLR